MTKDFDKLKLPPELVESIKSRLALPPDQQEALRLIGRRPPSGAPVPKRTRRETTTRAVLCAILRARFSPDGRVPDRIGKRELHRMITQLWREAWLRLIKSPPPEPPGRDTVDAARRSLNLPPAA